MIKSQTVRQMSMTALTLRLPSTMDEDEKLMQSVLDSTENDLDFSGLSPAPWRTKTANVQTVETTEEKSEKPDLSLLKKKPIEPSLFRTNLERFRFLCVDFPSPDIFIDFDFHVMIAACLARKVWLGGNTGNKLFPNQFGIAVADPGIGKSLPAGKVNEILKSLVETKLVKENGQDKLIESPLLNLGPDTITFEKLVMRCHSSSETNKMPEDMIKKGYVKYYTHSSTTFCLSDEITMLFTDQTRRVVSFLQKAWDCNDFEGDTIKHDVIKIQNICVNMLGCATPDIIRDLSRTGVFSQGMNARAIFMYGEKKRKEIYKIVERPGQRNEMEWLLRHLRKLCKLPPMELVLSHEADEWLREWTINKSKYRINQHKSLKDYYARKHVHIQKLAMAIHFSERFDNVIGIESLIAANQLLERIEIDMHKALAMTGENGQSVVMEEIKIYLSKFGATRIQKLKLEFFHLLDDEGLNKVIDFMLLNDIVSACDVDGKKGIKLK